MLEQRWIYCGRVAAATGVGCHSPYRFAGKGCGVLRRYLAVAILLAILPLLLACANAAEIPPPAPTATPLPAAVTAAPWPTATAPPRLTATPLPDLAALFPPPVPYDRDTPPYTVRTPVGLILNEPESFQGYTLFNRSGGKRIYLIDHQGRVVHQWTVAHPAKFARLLDNGSLLTMISPDGSNINTIQEIDPAGQVLWEYTAPGQHHDFLKMPNGNVLLLMQERKTAVEVIAWGGDPEAIGNTGKFLIDYIIEVRPTGPDSAEIVWQWSVWDHLIQDFAADRPNYGTVADHPELVDLNYRLAKDWLHANSIDYNAELDQIVLSARNYGELWIIDHSTTRAEAAGPSGGNGGRGGDLLYRWGNPEVYRAGTAADQQLFRPHNIHWIEPGLPGAGHILLFNNGEEISRKERFYSSIDEIAPPWDGTGYRLAAGKPDPPTRPLWTYTTANPRDWYASVRSGVQRLPNGNTLICSSRTGTIFEVTPAGQVVWGYISPVPRSGPLRQGDPMPLDRGRSRNSNWETWDNVVYRAYRYAPDYPGLQSLDLTPGDPIELAAAP